MGAIAVVLCGLGIVAMIWGAMQKYKAGRIAKTPFVQTGDAAAKGESVAGPKAAISVEGDVRCELPLVSPVTGTPCLYFELEVVGTWKDGDKTESKDYVKEKHAATFAIDDGSGKVEIVAEKGGDFDPLEKTFEETKKEGFFADLKNAIGNKEPIMFGRYAFANPPMSKADKFTCTERVLKVHPRLFAMGKMESHAVRSPSWASLVLSTKSRDQLLGSTVKAAKNFLIGGAVAAAAGLIMGVTASLLAPPEPEPVVAQVGAPAAIDTQEVVADEDEGAEVKVRSVCTRAASCCRVLNGESEACDSLDRATDEACESSLAGLRKAVRAAHPSMAAQCD